MGNPSDSIVTSAPHPHSSGLFKHPVIIFRNKVQISGTWIRPPLRFNSTDVSRTIEKLEDIVIEWQELIKIFSEF
ncbi:hypothetical protein L9F63_016665 [Diploptera punctata]|uniref:Uncharacterized protein n=1 Tax=Diploptera punctata TaxID=6984 RepID=A0AAD8EGZ5_DIPPU|nr:hypothetical protein L9F63_016665 [Diploptera punctata]